MIDYVVGFLFNMDFTEVLLIRKNRPDWQKGKLNGIGGHVDPPEVYKHAMKREFMEETGLNIHMDKWRIFHTIVKQGEWRCMFYFAVSDNLKDARSLTDEVVEIHKVADLRDLPVIDNLRWLLPMTQDPKHQYGTSYSL